MKTKTCDECGKKQEPRNIISECSDCYIKGAEKEKNKGKIEILTKLKSFVRRKGKTNMVSIYELEEFITENTPNDVKNIFKGGDKE